MGCGPLLGINSLRVVFCRVCVRICSISTSQKQQLIHQKGLDFISFNILAFPVVFQYRQYTFTFVRILLIGKIMSYQLEATIDIAFRVQQFRNLSEFFLRNMYFTIEVTAGVNQASPYQIISNSNPSKSNINLVEYISPLFTIGPYVSVQLEELVVFKLLVPASQLQTQELSYRVKLNQVVNTIKNQSLEIDVIELNHVSLLWIGSFVPLFFNKSRCAIEATVDTQLLTCRGKCLEAAPRMPLYVAIDSLIISYNRLRQKTNAFVDKQEEVPAIELEKYSQMEEIKKNMNSRIFQTQSLDEHRHMLIKFAGRFLPEINHKIQQMWNRYLKLSKKITTEYRLSFIKSYCLEVKQNVYHNEYNREEKEYLLVESIKMPCLPIKITPIFKQEVRQFQKGEGVAINHFVFIVHGYGATTMATQPIETTMKYLYPNLHIFNSRVNENRTEDNLLQIGRRLAQQVESILEDYEEGNNFNLSFIAHSMGGLIVRSALIHLEKYRYNMKNFITLSTPHFGHIYHNSPVNKFGMWAFSKIKNSTIMKTLLMDHENQDLRQSQLYQLSLKEGFNWFEQVVFYGSRADKFVSPESAFCITNESIEQDLSNEVQSAQIWKEMCSNIEKQLQNVGVSKFEVDFEKQNLLGESSLADEWFGRRDHMNLCNSQSFINCMLISNQHLFL